MTCRAYIPLLIWLRLATPALNESRPRPCHSSPLGKRNTGMDREAYLIRHSGTPLAALSAVLWPQHNIMSHGSYTRPPGKVRQVLAGFLTIICESNPIDYIRLKLYASELWTSQCLEHYLSSIIFCPFVPSSPSPLCQAETCPLPRKPPSAWPSSVKHYTNH